MHYFDKQINKILLNESVDLIVVGIADILAALGFEKLINRFDCDDAKAFHELENKILELKLNKKYRQSEKLELFLKKKRTECFNNKRGIL